MTAIVAGTRACLDRDRAGSAAAPGRTGARLIEVGGFATVITGDAVTDADPAG